MNYDISQKESFPHSLFRPFSDGELLVRVLTANDARGRGEAEVWRGDDGDDVIGASLISLTCMLSLQPSTCLQQNALHTNLINISTTRHY